MLAPIIPAIMAIIRIVASAQTAYEIYKISSDVEDGFSKYKVGLDEAKKEIEKQIGELTKEITGNISELEEVKFLVAQTKADPQGQNTKIAKGRGAGNEAIRGAIEQKIPFRKVISMVCDQADKIPVFGFKKEKGLKIDPSKLASIKRQAFEKLFLLTADEISDIEFEDLVVVRLKQLAANLIFEFIDEVLDWRSPLKCEVCFGPKPDYADHPLYKESVTRLRRDGKVNPFYPMPYLRGSISADLVMTDYRKRRCDKSNIFAIVEIKFPGDRINESQFTKYRILLDKSAKIKTAHSPLRLNKKDVNSGGRLSLFRYPEDIAATKNEHDKKTPTTNKQNKKI
ncbi:MAG: hypothetical protein ACRCU9_07685 [Iodobacter sp.]